jgi:hypothetical protein
MLRQCINACLFRRGISNNSLNLVKFELDSLTLTCAHSLPIQRSPCIIMAVSCPERQSSTHLFASILSAVGGAEREGVEVRDEGEGTLYGSRPSSLVRAMEFVEGILSASAFSSRRTWG